MVSDGTTELVLGGMELDWKAVARFQPCWANRFRTTAWGRGWSENLQREGSREGVKRKRWETIYMAGHMIVTQWSHDGYMTYHPLSSLFVLAVLVVN